MCGVCVVCVYVVCVVCVCVCVCVWCVCVPVAADQTQQMARQMSMQSPALSAKQNPNQLFKDEWEALQVAQHSHCLYRIEDQLMSSTILSPAALTDPTLKKII